ncbi:MAG: hypothetical protein RLZZ621_407, partial [Gemmatimonadota bacterium]
RRMAGVERWPVDAGTARERSTRATPAATHRVYRREVRASNIILPVVTRLHP